ncbi:MAG: bifunctional 2-polyprenyl-6-hydroxyphenol methylase/3-demethylubiquinol 3-O-methyltransferase UbiG, partial [Parvibaculales bacterium]
MSKKTTISAAEIARFSALADEWWDMNGSFAPLHAFTPIRVEYIRDRICTHFKRDKNKPTPLNGIKIMDIGCGGGLLCEPLARLGAEITGIDAAHKNIEVAKIHAKKMKLDIAYHCAAPEQMSEMAEQFDVVLNMEVVEHVENVALFLQSSATMLTPNGMMLVATLSRTAKSFLLAIIGAEYILRWLPRGTHEWDKFLLPDELAKMLEQAGLEIKERIGVRYHPISRKWSLSPDMDVNYMI